MFVIQSKQSSERRRRDACSQSISDFSNRKMSLLQHQWKTLSISLADAILTISMNRPKANAMSPELLNELIHAFNQASDDNKIKGVLLRSNLKYLYLP